MKDEIIHIRKKSLEDILLKIFLGEYWLWPACVKNKRKGEFQKLEVQAGQIRIWDEDIEDMLVCFNFPAGSYHLGCEAGGFELAKDKE